MDEKLSLVLQTPIEFNGFKIYQPTLQDIIDYGFDAYNNLLLPFLINKDLIQIDGNIDYDLFDLFTIEGQLQEKLLKTIDFFCKPNRLSISKTKIEIDEGFIDKNNFEDFGNIILKINSRTRPEEKKEQEPKSKKALEIMEKLRKGRERARKKNQLYLYDMIKVIEIGGNSYIPISEIKKMTMWNITELYSAILYKDGYDKNFDVFLISGDKELIQKHWTEQIKI